MLEATSCTRILGQASTLSLVYHAQTEMAAKGVNICVDNLPGLEDAFPAFCGQPKTEVPPYPPAPAPVNMEDPSMYIHSSGSTGFPKSIHFTYRRVVQWMSYSMLLTIYGMLRTNLHGKTPSVPSVAYASAQWACRPSTRWACSCTSPTGFLPAMRSWCTPRSTRRRL